MKRCHRLTDNVGRVVVGAYSSFWAWLCAENSAEDALELLEQWGAGNFSYDPAFRAKIGFSRREVLQYSGEFNALTSLHWCALAKLRAQPSASYSELIAEQYPKDYQLWREKVGFKNRNPEDYYPVPVHPWQWRNHLQVRFVPLIDSRDLLFSSPSTVKPAQTVLQ